MPLSLSGVQGLTVTSRDFTHGVIEGPELSLPAPRVLFRGPQPTGLVAREEGFARALGGQHRLGDGHSCFARPRAARSNQGKIQQRTSGLRVSVPDHVASQATARCPPRTRVGPTPNRVVSCEFGARFELDAIIPLPCGRVNAMYSVIRSGRETWELAELGDEMVP